MADMLKKVPVREQDPKVRATNFDEVCLGYNLEEAMDEGLAVDATCGRRTRTALIMESGHLVLSALTTETIAIRCRSGFKNEEKEEENDG